LAFVLWLWPWLRCVCPGWCWAVLEEVADGVDGGPEAGGGCAGPEALAADEVVQLVDVVLGGVRAGQVESGEEGGGGMPGHWLAGDVVLAEEGVAVVVHGCGEGRGEYGGEGCQAGAVLGRVDGEGRGRVVGGAAAEALE
jgi:hypothetical protein